MKITITIDDDINSNIPMELNNENIENDNFVEMKIDDKEYVIPVEDMFHALKIFDEIRRERIGLNNA